ncbi:MAG TPA: Hsp20/alpha crystallin family protein [Vicinamibacterales bacterium]|nr:Hsp20/alpha crystallin family protein [Vicinamibacterales bacterium]
MSGENETRVAKRLATRDPFALLTQMRTDLDRWFDEPFRSMWRWPSRPEVAETSWSPTIDVFEKDNRLITKVDLPGLKKEDVKVEVTDNQLAVSGERKREIEEKKDNVYRSEREYGSFYRSVPLPEGVKVEDVKATFSNGVLEVSMPVPPRAEAKARSIEIQEAAKTSKSAA